MIITLNNTPTGIHHQIDITIEGLLTEKDLDIIGRVIKLVDAYNEEQNNNA